MNIITTALSSYREDSISWDDRCQGEIGQWNHGAHFDDCFTHIWDGYPLPSWKPTEWMPEEGFGGVDLYAGM